MGLVYLQNAKNRPLFHSYTNTKKRTQASSEIFAFFSLQTRPLPPEVIGFQEWWPCGDEKQSVKLLTDAVIT